jgi:hypothetical protein
LKKGDKLWGGGRVACMVRSISTVLVAVGKLKITPYHPIRGQAGWVFPRWVGQDVPEGPVESFSFVLEGGVSMSIEGHEVLALGHGIGITDDPVAAHPYFGSAVLDDLRAMPGFDDGLVHVSGVERDPATGLVCGLRG